MVPSAGCHWAGDDTAVGIRQAGLAALRRGLSGSAGRRRASALERLGKIDSHALGGGAFTVA